MGKQPNDLPDARKQLHKMGEQQDDESKSKSKTKQRSSYTDQAVSVRVVYWNVRRYV